MAEEQLILVDEKNRTAGKTAVQPAGLLHRAFSIFIVDDRGGIVLQQRDREIRRRIKRGPHSFAFWFRHYFRKHANEIAKLAEQASA
jgi:hypothetical protein